MNETNYPTNLTDKPHKIIENILVAQKTQKKTFIARGAKLADFKPLPKRRIVEKTFAWLQNYRRLAKDLEYKTAPALLIQFAFIKIMLNKINSI
ncbi:MAG: hypothetical protein LBP63_05450 [Prevotellaceae bacterium]|jgi:transposase|nr:hypothetical protein [Prevotellaceae bacterium]